MLKNLDSKKCTDRYEFLINFKINSQSIRFLSGVVKETRSQSKHASEQKPYAK